VSVIAAGQLWYFEADWQLSTSEVSLRREEATGMQQIQVPKRGKRTLEPLDLRTPSGRPLPY
jgi:hypothetical protein